MPTHLPPLMRTLVLLPWALFGTAQPPPSEPQTLEYEVKAAYLLNFLSYAEWPAEIASSDQPVRLCIAGRDPFGGAIDRVVQAQRINERPVVVERLGGDDSAAHCALLFVPASVSLEHWLARAGAHTLTVGESSGFIKRGGIIELVVDAGRIRFDVNVGAAHSRNIRLSSRLLRLARATVRGPV